MRGTALLRAMQAACELTPAWHPLSCAQPALQRSGWDARASGPVMVRGVAKAHANKIRASGHHTPSSNCSTPNAPGRGPSRTRSHFHYTLLKGPRFLVEFEFNFWQKKNKQKTFCTIQTQYCKLVRPSRLFCTLVILYWIRVGFSCSIVL